MICWLGNTSKVQFLVPGFMLKLLPTDGTVMMLLTHRVAHGSISGAGEGAVGLALYYKPSLQGAIIKGVNKGQELLKTATRAKAASKAASKAAARGHQALSTPGKQLKRTVTTPITRSGLLSKNTIMPAVTLPSKRNSRH
jgi:hypothetical protein